VSRTREGAAQLHERTTNYGYLAPHDVPSKKGCRWQVTSRPVEGLPAIHRLHDEILATTGLCDRRLRPKSGR